MMCIGGREAVSTQAVMVHTRKKQRQVGGDQHTQAEERLPSTCHALNVVLSTTKYHKSKQASKQTNKQKPQKLNF